MHCNKDIQTYRLHIITVNIDLEDETVVKRIKLFKPDYRFGTDFLKQEEWINAHENQFESTVMMGVKAVLEVFAGRHSALYL